MSTEQPEALRLAAALDALLGYRGINADVGKAAAELRRLQTQNNLLGSFCDKLRVMHRNEMRPLLAVHDLNRELLEALIVARQEAIGWYAESRGFDPETDKHPDWLVQSDAAIAKATKE
jgi:hypothetical protein